MPVFAYEAVDGRQQRCTGTIAAETPFQARQQLRARGWAVAGLAPQRQAASVRQWLPRCRGSHGPQVAELWRNLAVLLNSGVGLSAALQVCIRQRRGGLQPVLRAIDEAVRSGRSLHEALVAHPRWFDSLSLALVRVGEGAGALPAALEQLAAYQDRSQSARQRVIAALLYPAILLTVGVGVVLFLMSFVVPQLVSVLAEAGRELPWITRVLKYASDCISGQALWLSLGLAAVVLTAGVFFRRDAGGRLLERMLLSTPFLGDWLRKAWVARMSLMLATLLRAEVRFGVALRQVRESLTQRLLADEFARLERAVEAGAGLADALRDSRILPPLVVHLLGVGQESGELPRMLEQLRDSYEREVQLALSRFLTVLEPLLILILAAAVGVVVYATLLPILETTKVVQ